MAPADEAEATQPKEVGIADAMALARELQKEARLEAADELYRRILAPAPDYPDAWHFRGVGAFPPRRVSPARALIRPPGALAPPPPGRPHNPRNRPQHHKRIDPTAK